MTARVRDRLLVLAALIASWFVASAVLGDHWVPSPVITAARLSRFAASGDLWFHTIYTLQSAALGFALGASLGFGLALLLRRRPITKAVLTPFLSAGYGAPKVAFAPLYIVLLGIGRAPKVALVASVVFFLVFFVTSEGLARVDASLVVMARLLGADDRLIFRDVILPSTVRYLVTSFRIGIPYAIGMAVVGEIVSSNRGLGYTIQAAAFDFDPAAIFVSTGVLAAVVMAVTFVLDAIERRIPSPSARVGVSVDAKVSF